LTNGPCYVITRLSQANDIRECILIPHCGQSCFHRDRRHTH